MDEPAGLFQQFDAEQQAAVLTYDGPQDHGDPAFARIEVKPHRIQRQRTKGWRMPSGAVYVGRPTRWGNPWRAADPMCFAVQTPQQAVDAFRRHCATSVTWNTNARRELRGKVLACWCRLDAPCHADVLLEMANG